MKLPRAANGVSEHGWKPLRGALFAGLCLAVSQAAPGPAGAAVTRSTSSDPASAAQYLAHAITSHLPPPPVAGEACGPAARAAVKSAVEAAVADAKATAAVAVAAIEAVRDQTPPLDRCRGGALADSAIESAGNGVVVDEAEAVRGFTLYDGPWPPPPRSVEVSSVTQAPDAANPAQRTPPPKAAVRPKGHRRVRDISQTPAA